MLKKFAVTNYRGFKDRIEWDLSNPSDYKFNDFAVKDGIVKNGIIYGPNGCGKSNLGMAIFDIEGHLSQQTLDIRNYTYANNNRNVKFEYTFRFGDLELQYNYSKDLFSNIETEEAFVNDRLVFCHRPNYFYYDKNEFSFSTVFVDMIEKSGNRMSIVNFITSNYPLPKDHYLLLLKDFAHGMLWFRSLRGNEFIGETEKTGLTLEGYIIENNLIEKFGEFLNQVSDQRFDFVRSSQDEKVLYCKIDNQPILFRQIASTGTSSLLLLFVWLKRIEAEKKSFVFIDEFDAFYHFKLAYEVCKKMFNLNCQVFMSSHNTYLMTNDLLRPDCNFVLNHNVIKPLCDCTEKELRFANNIEKLYRGGAFSL